MDVIFDTDIGDDIDDALALTLVLCSPELTLKAVVTDNRHEGDRALIASRLLSIAGRSDVPVFRGAPGGKGRLSQGEFIRDYFDDRIEGFKDYLRFLERTIEGAGERPVYLSLGSLTNLARIQKELPEALGGVEVVIMGGSLEKDYKGQDRPQAEWNIFSDVEAAQRVFGSGAGMTMVGLDATWDLELPGERLETIINSGSLLNKALAKLIPQWRAFYPERRLVLFDPFTVGILIDDSLARWEEVCLTVDDEGLTVKTDGAHNVRVAMDADKERFLKLFANRLLGEKV